MDDDYDYEQVLQYENEIYQVNEETSESETELTNALAQIYYAVDNSENNQNVVPKHGATKSDKVDDTIISKKITGTNNAPVGNNRSRSSQKDLKQELIHEGDKMLHKRKRISYDEEDYPSYGSGRQRGEQRGGQRCALCKGHNHDERTCEDIRYPDNDESTWRLYNKQEATEPIRNIRSYCYNCAGNHFGQNCPLLTSSPSSFRNGMWHIMKNMPGVSVKNQGK